MDHIQRNPCPTPPVSVLLQNPYVEPAAVKRQVSMPSGWALLPIVIATLLLLLGSWGTQALAAGPLSAPSAIVDCSGVTTVSANECTALVTLYNTTNGEQWTNQANWLATTAAAPCDWYGVACADGHVTELRLAANNLSGTLPITIGYLSELTALRLENNALGGGVPNRVCNVTSKLTDFSVAYNRFYPRYQRANDCLRALEPDWLATQTIAPRNLTISAFYTDALQLTWSAIPYTADGGYYEIAYATEFNGPYTIHGTTADKATTSYLADGLLPGQRYFFSVKTYTPPHDAQPSGLYSRSTGTVGVTQATTGNVLVAAYFPADNDLSSQIRYVAARFRRGTQYNPNVTVLLLVDGLGENNTRLLHIEDGVIAETTVVEDVWGVQELDTADPATLSWFLTYARATVPASKMIVSLMGHGLALAPEIEFAETLQSATVAHGAALAKGTFPALPREWEDMPNDVTDNSYMSTTDVGEALMAATDNGNAPFDVVYFDQCFQGNLDALYEVHKSADVFVASPNYAWLVAAYDKYIVGFSPNMSAEELALNIINPYANTLDRRHPNAIFAVRGNMIPQIADAVSALGDALRAAVNDGQNARIANAVRNSSYVDTTQCGRQNLQLGPPDELIGIEGFGQALNLEFTGNDSYGVGAALEQLQLAMQSIPKQARSGSPYIAPDEFWNYRDSLTILAPLPRNSPSAAAWRASIYRADAPFTATWTLDPTQPVTVTKSLAFVKEGRWDEFLDVWFQNLTPTVGQWCHYIPPEQVILDDAEVLTLTLTLEESNELQLDWTPTDDASAAEYLLYVDAPLAVSWELTQTLAISATGARFSVPDAGTYDVRVLARNNDNEFVAASNIATIDVTDPLSPSERQIYLPLVLR
ncbi:MAG: fibronectin type III domain-containing protein [Caldilineaceae bacterium]|nr:fibronectin type III domain-containing protein [Caldilineaceae bacterium]